MLKNFERLPELWRLVADAPKRYSNEKYLGLREIDFSEDLRSFEARYRTQVPQEGIVVVTTDIADVITAIQGREIAFHHISCASPKSNSVEDGTAFCIHTFSEKPQERYSIAIPGVNYVYSPETRRELLDQFAS